ncbi:RTC4-like domain-containing protein [Phyllosticta capitalensis]
MTGRRDSLRRRAPGLTKEGVKPLLRVVGGRQTDAANNDNDSEAHAEEAASNNASTPQRSTESSRPAASNKKTTPPPPPQLSEAEIHASPKSTYSEDEESAVGQGEEEPSPEMKQKPNYSETVKVFAGQQLLRGPRRTSKGNETRTPQRSSGNRASPNSLKRSPPDTIMDGGGFDFEGPAKKSKNVYGIGARKKVEYPKSTNFHAKGKGAVNGKNGTSNDGDSDSDSKPASSRKPLSNTTNTHKLRSLESPKSTKKPKAKLHIIGNPDPLDVPTSSFASNGVSPARSTKSERSPNSDLSSPPSSAQLEQEALDLELDNETRNANGNYDQPVECPMCGRPVDAEELSSWQWRVGRAGKTMRIGDQMAFCESHKMTEAQQEYAARSYPKIDFSALPARIERFRADLLAILQDTRPSHFRMATGDAAARGQLRNLVTAHERDQLGGMSVGYYGPRGRRVMERWVTTHLADTVRERAAADRLIAFKTPAGFMQEVLVPELATWLIMEDCRRDTADGEETGEARAREILQESGPVGDIVNRVVEGEPIERGRPLDVQMEWKNGDDDGGDEY